MSTTTPSSNRLPSAFWALNLVQSLGVFNSNLFRWVVVWALATRGATAAGTIDENQIFIVGALVAIPYILFSSAAGVLADRYSKRSLIVLWNLAAVVIMLIGALALMSNIPLLIYAAVFLLSTQAALFSPNKYGILPEIVPREKLSQANGLMESGLDLSIVLGTLAGGVAYAAFGQDVAGASTAACWRVSILCCGISVVATAACFFIPPTEACASGKKITPGCWQDGSRTTASVPEHPHLVL
ncbi:TPA: hypothetical protein DDW35_00980, partial [Candidatus Sumerlaeota bacterium]|nr:hypothetical protein [Candidatus Sumerlaeota bacterium]